MGWGISKPPRRVNVAVTIEYCVQWNYLPKAAGLAADLQRELGVTPTMIKGMGGVFEVKANGNVIFSKASEKRFPESAEVIDSLLSMMPGCG